MLPASALPVIVGVVSFVVVDSVASEMGALGAAVSTVMDKEAEISEVLPAVSVAVVFKEYVPSISAEDVIEKSPFASAISEPNRVEPL